MYQVDVVIMHSCSARTMIALIGFTACTRMKSCYNVIIRDLGSNDTLNHITEKSYYIIVFLAHVPENSKGICLV